MTDTSSLDPPPRAAPPGILGDWYEERGYPEAAILARFGRQVPASWCLEHESDEVRRFCLELGRFLIEHGADPATMTYRVAEGLFEWKARAAEAIASGWLLQGGWPNRMGYPVTLYRGRKRGRSRPRAARG